MSSAKSTPQGGGPDLSFFEPSYLGICSKKNGVYRWKSDERRLQVENWKTTASGNTHY